MYHTPELGYGACSEDVRKLKKSACKYLDFRQRDTTHFLMGVKSTLKTEQASRF
jgi:hypothetical protein